MLTSAAWFLPIPQCYKLHYIRNINLTCRHLFLTTIPSCQVDKVRIRNIVWAKTCIRTVKFWFQRFPVTVVTCLFTMSTKIYCLTTLGMANSILAGSSDPFLMKSYCISNELWCTSDVSQMYPKMFSVPSFSTKQTQKHSQQAPIGKVDRSVTQLECLMNLICSHQKLLTLCCIM